MQKSIGSSSRISLVDSLRGLALLAIVLLHNLEHYNLYYFPDWMPDWLKTFDKGVWDAIFFIFAGKAYAKFSFLFGFSFYIQLRNAEKRGEDFRGRFAWRMVVLFCIAQLHALFYNGDILVLYAVVGLTLIPVCRLKDKTVLMIAVILLLQPVEIGKMIYCVLHPDFVFNGDYFLKYAKLAQPVMENGTVWETLKSNIFNGQLYSNFWQVENGRLFQSSALFMFGMLAGRRKIFVKSPKSIIFWKKMLLFAVIVYLPLLAMKTVGPEWITNRSIFVSYSLTVSSLVNCSFMVLLVALFSLLWFKKEEGYALQRMLVPYGRMSLTNYITQSYIGVFVYYGMGLGLYQYTGATFSTLIAVGIFAVQLAFSRYWLSRHKQGPFEALWRKLTWIGTENGR